MAQAGNLEKIMRKYLEMTAAETAIYDADGQAATELMDALRKRAQDLLDNTDQGGVEIYTADGIVADFVE